MKQAHWKLGQISPREKINNVKKGQILKIVSFSETKSLNEKNGTIINAQLIMTLKEFNFFKNFKKLLMGGAARQKTEKFWQIEKKKGDLHELDDFHDNEIFVLGQNCKRKFFEFSRAQRYCDFKKNITRLQ